MSDRTQTYIYESPDGGHTVYRRAIGASAAERDLHSISKEKSEGDLRMTRQNLWHDILGASDRDPSLRAMLDQVEVYYRLKSQP